MLPSTWLVRHDVPLRFHTWAKVSEDSSYLADLSQLGDFVFVDEPLMGYRRHGGSITKRPYAVVDSLNDKMRWLAQSTLTASEQSTLRHDLLRFAADEIRLARYMRKWDRYRLLQQYVRDQWKSPEPLPKEATERALPPWIYRLRDAAENWPFGRRGK